MLSPPFPHCSRFEIINSALFAVRGRRSNVGVLGRLVESASLRSGLRAGATTDSRSKYDCSPFFSLSAILICGGLGFVSSPALLYRYVAERTTAVPSKYYALSVSACPMSDRWTHE